MTPGADTSSPPSSSSGGESGRERVRALAALLARRLGESPEADGGALTVAELRRTLLPYPRCRRELGLASKAEYDVALLRLLAEDAYLRPQEDGLREAVQRELASPEPGLGILDDWAAATLRPSETLGRTGGGQGPSPDAGSAGVPSSDAGSRDAGSPDAGSAGEAPLDARRRDARSPGGPSPEDRPGEGGQGKSGGPSPTRGGTSTRERGVTGGAVPSSGECRSCGHELPDREGVRFCPHCGADQRTPRCSRCQEPQERGWRYCPFCGSENDE